MRLFKPIRHFKRRFPALRVSSSPSSSSSSSSSNYIDGCIDSFLTTQTLPKSFESLLKHHSLILTTGNSNNPFIASKLISLYASFHQPNASTLVFDSIFPKDVFLWNSLIKSHFSNGNYPKAFDLFVAMRLSSTLPNDFTIPMVVSALAELSWLQCGEYVHGFVTKCRNFAGNSAVGSSFVYFYGKCGCLRDACHVFDEMAVRDVVAWTSIIITYIQNGESEKGLAYLCEMHRVGDDERPNSRTLEGGFKACVDLGALMEGRCLHGLAVKNGLSNSQIVQSSVLSMYSKLENPSDAYLSFCELDGDRDLLSWTSVIGVYARFGFMEECLNMFWEMQISGIYPDNIVISCMINGFGNSMLASEGKTFHGVIIRRCYLLDQLVHSALLSMYFKFGLVSIAEKIFRREHPRNKDAWNIMVKGYGKMRCEEECTELFRQMQNLGIGTDSTGLVSVILSCSHLGATRLGKSVHCYVVRSHADANISVVNSLIDMYGKIGDLTAARKLFCAAERTIITWNTMISSYAHHGRFSEAISLFDKMISEKLKPNSATLGTLLMACSNLASLEKGENIHRYIKGGGYEISLSLATALIDMYAKCGQLEKSREVFDSVKEKDAVCWNVMILGYGMHGDVKSAMEIFHQMEGSASEPTELTFLALISACMHAGLVDEGKHVFCRMRHYNVTPNLKHYACMVDLFARSGNLQEAEALVTSMPFPPDGAIWGTLLSSCVTHNEFEMGIRMAERAIECDPKNDGYYIMLANMYSSTGMWEEAERTREMMKERGVGKQAGQSAV